MMALGDPNIAFAALAIGLLAIYAELVLPGWVWPGVVGGVVTVTALAGLITRPAGAMLFVLAFILFFGEARVGAHGMLGLAGAAAMVAGAVLLRVKLASAVAVAAPLAWVTVILLTVAVRAHENKRVRGSAALVGEIGVARTDLAPGGKVFLDGELWEAKASRPAPAGAKVRVTAIQGLTLTVDRSPE